MNKKFFNILNWLEGGRAPPFILELRPTSKCNLNCISCGQSKRQVPNELPEEKLASIVNDASRMGVSKIEICGGGEPLMRADTVKIMLLIKNLGMEGCLTTNGTLFTEESIKKLVESEWDEILLSLDAPDAETHDYLRQTKGCFDKVIRNLGLFKKWKQEFKKSKPIIKLVPVFNNRNCKKLEGFMELARLYDVKEVRFQPLYAFTEEHKSLELSPEDVKRLPSYVKKAAVLARKYKIDTNVTIFLKELFTNRSLEIYKSNTEPIKSKFETKPGSDTCSSSDIKPNPSSSTKSDKDDKPISKLGITGTIASVPCFFPWVYIGILYDGKILPCPAFDIYEAKNIGKKSLLDVWYGEEFGELREAIMNHSLPKICERCCGGLIIDNKDIKKHIQFYLKYRDNNFFLEVESVIARQQERIERVIREKFEVMNERDKTTAAKNELINIYQHKIRRQQREIYALKRHLIELQNSLSFKVGSKLGKTPVGKFFKKHSGNKWKKK